MRASRIETRRREMESRRSLRIQSQKDDRSTLVNRISARYEEAYQELHGRKICLTYKDGYYKLEGKKVRSMEVIRATNSLHAKIHIRDMEAQIDHPELLKEDN